MGLAADQPGSPARFRAAAGMLGAGRRVARDRAAG